MYPDVLAIIPCRVGSTRFPNKGMAKVGGEEMVWKVHRVANRLVTSFIATDQPEQICRTQDDTKYIWHVDGDIKTGHDRVASAVNMRIHGSRQIINLQGDEPMLRCDDLKKLIEYPIEKGECVGVMAIDDCVTRQHMPYCVVDNDSRLLYMSRNPVPGVMAGTDPIYYRQVGMFKWHSEDLVRLYGNGARKSEIESVEDICLLRALSSMRVKMIEVAHGTHPVDTPDDINIVEGLLESKRG